MNEDKKFDQWCVVELFGHNVLAGKVTEQQIGGQAFVRVDVPSVNGSPEFTKFFGTGAVYCLTPTNEATARAVVAQHQPRPITVYVMPSFQLPEGDEDEVPA